jgi:hypothetical protein
MATLQTATTPAQSLTERDRLLRHARVCVTIVIFGLLASGVTAFPLEWELNGLHDLLSNPALPVAALFPALVEWIALVRRGLTETTAQFPFLVYGTDWLAFAHIVIAIAFIGPLRDPVRNRWVIDFGLIACGLVIPLALIAGPLRGIPFFWQLIDCSFGVVGAIPLWLARRAVQHLENSTACLNPKAASPNSPRTPGSSFGDEKSCGCRIT